MKKKKKPKKAVHHAEPDPTNLHLGAGPPAQPSAEEDATAAAPATVESPRAETSPIESPSTPWDDEQRHEPPHEGEEHTSGYQVSDSEEFRNVWGGDSAPK